MVNVQSDVCVRTYQAGDEKEIVSLWNRSLPFDPISNDIFTRKVLLDVNFQPEGLFIATTSNGDAIGFLFAVIRQLPLAGDDLEISKGWISFFAVDPLYRQQKVGTILLEAAEKFFRQNGRTQIGFSPYAPNYFLPGIDRKSYPEAAKFLEKHGFQVQYSPVAMDTSLLDFVYPSDVREVEEKLVDQGYSFEAISDRYLVDTLAFVTNYFNPDWTRAIRDALVHRLPYDQVLISRKEEQIVGFCMFGGYDNVGERFGPFGVDPSLRGTGLGKVLLYKCMETMKGNGLHGAWFLWTGEESPAGHLYKRANFKVTRQFDVLQKSLL